MSFLEQLKSKRNQLQQTSTVVTTPTGERFLESRTSATTVRLDKLPYGFVEDTKPDAIPAEILKNFLYLGSQDAVSAENVKTYKFTHILSVGINAALAELGLTIQHKYLSLLDLPESSLLDGNTMQEAFAFIEAARNVSGRVLVHCNAGVSRSASVAIAYLIQREQMDFQSAYELVKSKRACIQPNAGFMRQLRDFQPGKVLKDSTEGVHILE